MRLQIFRKDGRGKTCLSYTDGQWSEREVETPYTQVRNQTITDALDINMIYGKFKFLVILFMLFTCILTARKEILNLT